MSVIQTDLLNYVVKSLSLDCVPALTNVNMSKFVRLSLKLEDISGIFIALLRCIYIQIKINCLVDESRNISSLIMIMQSRVFATDCH